MYVSKCRTVYVVFGVYFPELRSNEGNKHQINTRVNV